MPARPISNSNKNKRVTQQKAKKDIDLKELFSNQRTKAVQGKAKSKRNSIESNNNGRQPSLHTHEISKRADQFADILTSRHDEALRTVLVRTHHPDGTLQKLQSFGTLEYAAFTSTERSYILAQYKESEHLESLMRDSSSFFVNNQFPMRSRCICDNPRSLHTRNKKMKNLLTAASAEQYPSDRNDSVYTVKESFDAEVLSLHSRKCLTEIDLRQRFFICSLLEDSLKSLLPDARVTPYGSCINGFGWWDGDLDMMLSFHGSSFLSSHQAHAGEGETLFKFLTEVFSTERQVAQRTLSALAGIVELMPRVTRVIKILNARVPIIRFRHAALELQCDLSLQALDSIKMTEILYLLSMVDPRVQPLMTAVKQWALHHRLTSSGEQQKPTTLGFLCLLIFYLQSCHPAILPSLRQLQTLADTGSGFEIEGVHYRLPASPTQIPSSSNTESLESLLTGFFTFYASFNFEKHAISLIEGSSFSTSDKTSPLYVENPLCIGLNICRNVNQMYVEQLQRAMSISAQTMNQLAGQTSPAVARLTTLFEKPSDDAVHINIHSLFGEEGNTVVEKAEGTVFSGSEESAQDEKMEAKSKSENVSEQLSSDSTADSADRTISLESKVV